MMNDGPASQHALAGLVGCAGDTFPIIALVIIAGRRAIVRFASAALTLLTRQRQKRGT